MVLLVRQGECAAGRRRGTVRRSGGVGVTDIRVAGHCGCPPPKDWITFLADDGREVLDREQEASWQELIDRGHTKMQTYKDEYVFADDPAKVGKPYVTSYHIDSELGLRIFADTLKKHGLTGTQHRDRAGGQDQESTTVAVSNQKGYVTWKGVAKHAFIGS